MSVSVAKTNNKWQRNNVDVLCTDETLSKWIVADFHSHVESIQAKNLRKAMLAHSSLHLLNCTLTDFDETTGELSSELKEIIEWQMSNTTSTLVLIIRDFMSKAAKNKLPAIKEKLIGSFGVNKVILLTLENISNKEDSNRLFRIKKVIDGIKEITADESNFRTKAMHSMRDVKIYFEKLCKNPNEKFIESNISDIEVRFDDLFKVKTFKFKFFYFLFSRANS